ncbi:MAG: hypothetical protein LBU43_02420 [Candidatus Accumulibacter sp.]|jgi:hypothetical protein|nr:hypothetical protein [Accumulibacter sp.]
MIKGTEGAFVALGMLNTKIFHWFVSCGIIIATQIAILLSLRWQGIKGARLELIGLITTIITVALIVAHTIHAFALL